MGIGFGSLKQMNDTIQQNRRLLKKTGKTKSKQVREAYQKEMKALASHYDNINLEELKQRVRKRLQRNIIQERVTKVISLFLVASFVVAVIWLIISFDFTVKTVKKESPFKNTDKLFKTEIYPEDQAGYKRKVDYYHYGAKAAETMMKDDLKHQNSESYYPSGEQFRSALYYYDTLVREVYFFKDGDTIKNFPSVDHHKVYHIKLSRPDKNQTVEFYFFDGKIIQNTYYELPYIHSN